jgi:hypothetical protein
MRLALSPSGGRVGRVATGVRDRVAEGGQGAAGAGADRLRGLIAKRRPGEAVALGACFRGKELVIWRA